MQTNMNLTTQEELKHTWAFAVCPAQPRVRKALSPAAIRSSYISSCSRQARVLGIRPGMPYQEAKETVPGIRILLIGGKTS